MALTDVGAYGGDSQSAYGTNDQAGSIFELTDGVLNTSRVGRGGSWINAGPEESSSYRIEIETTFQSYSIGFRVASSVPEPSSAAVMLVAGSMILRRRRR